ncbi:MAG: hypothetical protein WBC53_09575, partial [Phycisphaerae bacterium]
SITTPHFLAGLRLGATPPPDRNRELGMSETLLVATMRPPTQPTTTPILTPHPAGYQSQKLQKDEHGDCEPLGGGCSADRGYRKEGPSFL